MTQIENGKQQWLIIPLILLYLGIASLYNIIVPLWETPDEVGHFDYAVHLVEQRSLPRQRDADIDVSAGKPGGVAEFLLELK